MSIHNSGTRIVIAFLVLIIVVLAIEPHLMNAEPPLYVKILLAPASFAATFVGRVLPHGNIGSAEHPIIEGTPLDLMAGSLLILFCVFLYPVATYLLLSLISRFLRSRT